LYKKGVCPGKRRATRKVTLNTTGILVVVKTSEPMSYLVPGSSLLEVETATAKLKKYKSPGSDQIPAEVIQAGG
jgi:hypothetical protein